MKTNTMLRLLARKPNPSSEKTVTVAVPRTLHAILKKYAIAKGIPMLKASENVVWAGLIALKTLADEDTEQP